MINEVRLEQTNASGFNTTTMPLYYGVDGHIPDSDGYTRVLCNYEENRLRAETAAPAAAALFCACSPAVAPPLGGQWPLVGSPWPLLATPSDGSSTAPSHLPLLWASGGRC